MTQKHRSAQDTTVAASRNGHAPETQGTAPLAAAGESATPVPTPKLAPKARRSLALSMVPKPTLTEEAAPSAKMYQGAPPGEKFFRVLFVDGMTALQGHDEAGVPIVEFQEFYVISYEGVNFLVSLEPEDLAALQRLTTLKRRYHIPCVTEDGAYTVWIMAVPWPRKTAVSHRFRKDDAQAREQTQILQSMRENKDAAVLATHTWIRREFDQTLPDRQFRIIPAEGKKWQNRQPQNPGFDAETWVYGCYGNNIIDSLDHDVVKALRGLLDEDDEEGAD